MTAALRVCLRILKAVCLAPFSAYYRHRLDVIAHRVPFPQDDNEFQWFCRRLQSANAASYLEIGSRHGGSLLMAAHYLRPGAKLVCVDLPGAEWGELSSEQSLLRVADVLRKRGFQVTCILGDSHLEDTVRQVQAHCPQVGFDVVFLDGDHTYDGIKQDWEAYASLGSERAMVVFHDLITPTHNPRVEVGRLFDELGQRYESERIVRTWGLGVVYRP